MEPHENSVPPDFVGPFGTARRDADILSDRLGSHQVAVVLGSGWAEVTGLLGSTIEQIPVTELPGAPAPTVSGHSGTISSVSVPGSDGVHHSALVFAGRSHLYEGHTSSAVVHTVRAAVLHGCRRVILTNAAGSLRSEIGIQAPVLISDHLNLTGQNPLCGDDPPPGIPGRFVDLSRLYSRRLIDAVRAVHGAVPEGVYAGVLGGTYETPAEIRMLRTLGADLVGMSTVLEAIAAHHLGAEVLGISLVTNLAAGMGPDLDHGDVLAAGQAAGAELASIISTAAIAG